MNAIPGPSTGTLGYIAELVDGRETTRVDFHFNPDTIQMSQNTSSAGSNAGGGSSGSGQGPWAPRGSSNRSRQSSGSGSAQPSGGSSPPASLGPVEFRISKLYFDGGFERSVLPEVLQLFDWLKPSSNGSKGTPTPPQAKIVFYLGTTKWMTGYIKSMSISFTMFTPFGLPTRALIDPITIDGDDSSLPRQNPTSGGLASYSAVVLNAGDSLESIAYREYGHPRLWRELALVNGFDDPFRVRPGTTVMLPTLNEIVKVG